MKRVNAERFTKFIGMQEDIPVTAYTMAGDEAGQFSSISQACNKLYIAYKKKNSVSDMLIRKPKKPRGIPNKFGVKYYFTKTKTNQ